MTHDHGAMGHGAGSGLNAMAASATLHCLTGCAVGEVLGMMIGAAVGLSTVATVVLAVALAFLFGYSLSTLPLLASGLSVGAALSVVLAADTLSIVTMELVDNGVMMLVPGAMEATLAEPVFWLSMALALGVAYAAAYPVNRALLARGRGHALTHDFHGAPVVRRWVPTLGTATLAVAIGAFLVGGLVASLSVPDEPAPSQRHAEGDTPHAKA
ncbi:DUF4396 domain-containing protein [Nocardioides lijunqiniae]|uniref:DUF4396 domain-containing protein n=1 Tax=Nocardioides lijunqiniae TaxID=2760832 RepID=UPI001D0CD074|nr:DUF4396 domain-containing protein [Nocardioides lijunqiniae]